MPASSGSSTVGCCGPSLTAPQRLVAQGSQCGSGQFSWLLVQHALLDGGGEERQTTDLADSGTGQPVAASDLTATRFPPPHHPYPLVGEGQESGEPRNVVGLQFPFTLTPGDLRWALSEQ